MKPPLIVPNKNLNAFKGAFGNLVNRSGWVPGMGLVTGEPGLGKTTALVWLANQTNCLMVTATPYWSAGSMLRTILQQAKINPGGSSIQAMHDLVVRYLRENNQSLLVDEADYCFEAPGRRFLVEGLRSIHDHSNAPIVLVGMGSIWDKLHRYPQLQGRISRSVTFTPLDAEDTLRTLQAIVDVEISPCLAERVQRETRGYIRNIIVAAETIEPLAKAKGWGVVTSSAWGEKPLFATSRRAA